MTNLQQTIVKNAAANRFRVNDIPTHSHTTINSPPAYQPTIFYTGRVVYNGGTSLYQADSPFPNNFTVSTITVGSGGGAEITHNLGSVKNYTLVVTPEWQNNATIAAEVVRQSNSFNVVLSNGGGNVTGNFFFLMTIVNNTSLIPKYT